MSRLRSLIYKNSVKSMSGTGVRVATNIIPEVGDDDNAEWLLAWDFHAIDDSHHQSI